MRDRMWRWILVLALAAIAGAMWHGQISPALAQGGGVITSCTTCVAVIDVDRVLSQLQEKGDREAELQGFGQGLQDELDQLQATVKQMENDLKVLARGTPEYEKAALQLLDARQQLEFKRQVAEVRFGERQKSITVAMFNQIADAATRYAQREGIDIVLSDDQAMGLSNDLPNEVVQARLQTKKVIYAMPSKDITDDVATMMNNEYRAQP